MKSCRGFSFSMWPSKACWGHVQLEGRRRSRRHSGGWSRWNVHCCVSWTTGQRGVSFGTTVWLATGVSPVLIISRRFLRKTALPDLIRKLGELAESRQVAGVQTFCPCSLIPIIGSFRNYYGDAEDKIEFIFYLRISRYSYVIYFCLSLSKLSRNWIWDTAMK